MVLLALLALGSYLPVAPEWRYPLRTLAVAAALLAVSRGVTGGSPSRWLASAGVGIAVFAVWILPDLVFPGYRQHWIFQNQLIAGGGSILPENAYHRAVFLLFRVCGSVLVVPVAEELFWRAWLMRRLIAPDFERVPLGAYAAGAFWLTALLFASEHGAYWDVGLAAGIAYNWWMVRTRNLADCILAHAVTNACLGGYVIATGAWQYWL